MNHGLHPAAAQWSRHCRALARTLHVPLQVEATKVRRSEGVSLEEAAREARYGLLARALAAGEYLLTGHHEDDQLETVLLQLFRGSGLRGLAAMPEVTPFARGYLARPLLSRSRQELEQWVRAAGLHWIEDETNSNEHLDRNYLRRSILPLIRERWHGVGAAVSRSARHAAEAQRLLDVIARGDVERAAVGADLSVKALRALQPDRRRNALRFWIVSSGVRTPDTRRLRELAGPVIDARSDASPLVVWSDAQVRRHADLLSIERSRAARHGRGAAVIGGDAGGRIERSARQSPEAGARQPIDWDWREHPSLVLPENGGTLELKSDPHGPVALEALPPILTIRWRRGGEVIRIRRGGPRRALKSLLQEAHVPIAERARQPLIFAGANLLAAGAMWLDASIQATRTTLSRGRLNWRR